MFRSIAWARLTGQSIGENRATRYSRAYPTKCQKCSLRVAVVSYRTMHGTILASRRARKTQFYAGHHATRCDTSAPHPPTCTRPNTRSHRPSTLVPRNVRRKRGAKTHRQSQSRSCTKHPNKTFASLPSRAVEPSPHLTVPCRAAFTAQPAQRT